MLSFSHAEMRVCLPVTRALLLHQEVAAAAALAHTDLADGNIRM